MRKVRVNPQDALPDLENCYDGLILHLLEINVLSYPTPGYVKAVLRQESRFNPLAVSVTGAEGLGQLVDRTWDSLDRDPSTEESTTDIFTNISRTIRNLAPLFPWAEKRSEPEDIQRFVAAGYNLGQGNVQSCQEWVTAAGADPRRWDNVAEVIHLALVKRGWTEEKADNKERETKSYVPIVTWWAEIYDRAFAGRKAEG